MQTLTVCMYIFVLFLLENTWDNPELKTMENKRKHNTQPLNLKHPQCMLVLLLMEKYSVWHV